jgi:hypothetical protein
MVNNTFFLTRFLSIARIWNVIGIKWRQLVEWIYVIADCGWMRRLQAPYKLCSTVCVLVVLLLALVWSVISLDNCVELYILVCYGQKWTDIGPFNVRI